ncbi:MAG: tRNA 2-thiouridine(34) synthase MnmA, partial [Candidatus Zixiibacteriota bacterium]
RFKLKNAEQKESREICFVADNDYRRFLKEWEAKRGRGFRPGDIVGTDGRILGRHNGIAFYTIGQRRGLGISNPTPLYVRKLIPEEDQVVVGDNASLFNTDLTINGINWVALKNPAHQFRADVKIRYLHQPAPSTVRPINESSAEITLDKAQRAITPGQSAVFYEKDTVLGGGIIT